MPRSGPGRLWSMRKSPRPPPRPRLRLRRGLGRRLARPRQALRKRHRLRGQTRPGRPLRLGLRLRRPPACPRQQPCLRRSCHRRDHGAARAPRPLRAAHSGSSRRRRRGRARPRRSGGTTAASSAMAASSARAPLRWSSSPRRSARPSWPISRSSGSGRWRSWSAASAGMQRSSAGSSGWKPSRSWGRSTESGKPGGPSWCSGGATWDGSWRRAVHLSSSQVAGREVNAARSLRRPGKSSTQRPVWGP
mmetsp:Transcript_87733/g.272885  ORF Transcript_87733/g.272885 Transcript_87733/m.272885 type:complete len:248 (-) Transcript_87733:673-1416(-)